MKKHFIEILMTILTFGIPLIVKYLVANRKYKIIKYINQKLYLVYNDGASVVSVYVVTDQGATYIGDLEIDTINSRCTNSHLKTEIGGKEYVNK